MSSDDPNNNKNNDETSKMSNDQQQQSNFHDDTVTFCKGCRTVKFSEEKMKSFPKQRRQQRGGGAHRVTHSFGRTYRGLAWNQF
mmetsp:Transcript_4559/g.6670  ORF Transcript_4559/g.6670 Transcript_4559/m.6670 type:complete len:84 (+) Transcript_4559:161-412(+)|eukprot:CAMPEP_0116025690 /NCGR_PEP_ID=MMETSP0321-20121206/13242_1 /TAXON_ID=163516 /ORGANISM="Leptocylindrus danicus var. danicus, Strain B650" /LENGTH=83 /DNA_ID=CAMNT_0003498019 /DNA_START=149 /DNA_END=400 /DNA_ORIENTATION=+